MTDLYGNRYNGVYPPEYKYNGDAHHGYKTDKEETLFYDFAVRGYDLMISYQDKFYYFMVDLHHTFIVCMKFLGCLS